MGHLRRCRRLTPLFFGSQLLRRLTPAPAWVNPCQNDAHGPTAGAALRLAVFSTGYTSMRWQNGLQRLSLDNPRVFVCGPFQPGYTVAQPGQLGAQLGNVGKPCQRGGNRGLCDLLSV